MNFSSVKDPYDVNPAGSNLIIEVYGYRNFLPRHNVMRVIEDAEMVVVAIMGDDRMGSEPLPTVLGDGVQLVLILAKGVTWRD